METIQIAKLNIKPGERVLDLGCGEGRHSIALTFHHPECKVIGLDLNYDDLITAKAKHQDFKANNQHCVYLQSDGACLPFANNSFDHVICSEVLEHIPNYTAFLDEIARISKAGASLSISVPRAWPEKICWRLSKDYHQVEGGHVRIFNAKNLQKHIIEAGFIFKHKHGAHALHSLYWWLRCLKWNNGKDNSVSKVYHKLLVWDLMKRPALTRIIEALSNPFLGKSIVMYFNKTGAP